MEIRFTREDCIPSEAWQSCAGHWVFRSLTDLKEEYQTGQFQLFYAGGGFGCDKDKIGTGVFGYYAADGESCRIEKYDIIGIAKPEAIEKWISIYGPLKGGFYGSEEPAPWENNDVI